MAASRRICWRDVIAAFSVLVYNAAADTVYISDSDGFIYWNILDGSGSGSGSGSGDETTEETTTTSTTTVFTSHADDVTTEELTSQAPPNDCSCGCDAWVIALSVSLSLLAGIGLTLGIVYLVHKRKDRKPLGDTPKTLTDFDNVKPVAGLDDDDSAEEREARYICHDDEFADSGVTGPYDYPGEPLGVGRVSGGHYTLPCRRRESGNDCTRTYDGLRLEDSGDRNTYQNIPGAGPTAQETFDGPSGQALYDNQNFYQNYPLSDMG